MNSIYLVSKPDAVHPSTGHWIAADTTTLRVGPFRSEGQARSWIEENATRLIELEGPTAAMILPPPPEIAP